MSCLLLLDYLPRRSLPLATSAGARPAAAITGFAACGWPAGVAVAAAVTAGVAPVACFAAAAAAVPWAA